MLTNNDLSTLLSNLESDRVERTSAVKDNDKFSKAVCAFANDLPHHRQPGYLLVGVNDDGTLSGLSVSDELLLTLADLRSAGNILPIPHLTVSRFRFEGGEVAVVEVFPSDLPPVRYKGQVHIRVGPRKAIASEQEERVLIERRVSHASTFDASACRVSTLEDLDLRTFEHYRSLVIDPEVIQANHRSLENQLASLQFYDLSLGCPSHAGILAFGKKPRSFLPGAYIQFLQIDGTSLVDPILDQEEISGDMLTVLHEAELRLKIFSKTTLKRTDGFQELLLHDYPLWSLREFVGNALMHRSYQSNAPVRLYCYADRIEIQNAGGLYGTVTPDNYNEQNDYRNPVLANVLKGYGFINRYGYGIRRAQAELEKNGNPPARFEFEPHHVRVTVYTKGDGQ